MVDIRANKNGVTGRHARRIAVVCLLVGLNTSADMIVDLGAVRDFMFLDINESPSMNALLSKGVFNGDVAWSGGAGTKVKLRKGTLSGGFYHADGSKLKLKKGAEFLGEEYSEADMTSFVEDVEAAVSRFGTLTQDIDLGVVNQIGALTINRTDAYTVVDVSEFKLSSGTLTLNGEANDIFYIRVRDIFELNNVDVVVNGTDSSRVFFIYGGSGDLEFKRGDFLGNIVAPNATVLMSGVNRFDGSVVSGNGFSIKGANKKTVFEHVAAIPESTVLGLVAVFGCAAIFIHRVFRVRKFGSGT